MKSVVEGKKEMATKMNYARIRFSGRPTERAVPAFARKFHPNQCAKGGEVRQLSAEERAQWAAERGYDVAA